MHQPTEAHWQAVKRILRYLKGTASYGIALTPSSDLSLSCYTDADWASCPDDRSTVDIAHFLAQV